MEEQDKVLDLLGDSVVRSKEIAHAIGKEVDEQAPLLDELHDHVDKTGAKVRNTTRRVERVEKKAQTRGMWCVILVLVLVLVGVSFAAVYT